MNRQFFKISSILRGFLLTGFIAVSSWAFAAGSTKSNGGENVHPTVKYLGAVNNSTLIEVAFNPEKETEFDLVIKDPNGDQLFREHLVASNFSKVFKLVNENGDPVDNLAFQIETGGDTTYRFTINSSVSIVREVEITKI